MSYGGIDQVEIDEDFDYFYVHREAGYWNRYRISDEIGFLAWTLNYAGEIGNVSYLERDE